MQSAKGQDLVGVYVHLVWGTWDRAPLITPLLKPRLYRCLQSQARKLSCGVLAVGGTDDHVHMLVQDHATVAIANLVKQIKGASSHFANTELHSEGLFRWQPSYGAFSVSRWDIPRISQYIQGQEKHHSARTMDEYMEPPILVPSQPAKAGFAGVRAL